MIQFAILLVALVLLVSLAFVLIVSALFLLAFACLVGIPLYFIGRNWMRRQGIRGPVQTPIERLRNLYVDGKIDLFEFEQRLSRLLSMEH
jgi:hypothetical protein